MMRRPGSAPGYLPSDRVRLEAELLSEDETTTRKEPMVTSKFREHPGEMLLVDFIQRHGLTPSQVAQDIGVSSRRMGEIVRGTRPLTPETSIRLGRYFGISERFWMRIQMDYDMAVERARLGRRVLKEVSVLGEGR